jgi:hypothetical protein
LQVEKEERRKLNSNRGKIAADKWAQEKEKAALLRTNKA